ncbi:MAG TPA: ROK family protein [Acidimicrobiia bacterium]|nr:ROK family protein [Acidimicrobiia bacterium]
MTALGMDVGGSTLKVVALDDDDVIVHSSRVAVPEIAVSDFVVGAARRAVAEHAATTLGLGVAGLVKFPAGEFVWGPHLDGTSIPYRSMLAAELGFDVAVDNDANLAAYAEWAIGAGERKDPLVMITLGTGIGAGFVLDGRVYRGASFAGEAGHIEVAADGEVCSCGRNGCWETFVSGAKLDRLAVEIARTDPGGGVAAHAGTITPTGIHLAKAAAEGDSSAVAAIHVAGRWLGRGLVNLVLLFDPVRIVIGGAAGTAGPALLDPARAVLAETMPGASYRLPVPVCPARFGSLSGAVGAALAGRRVHNGHHDW